MIICTTYFSFHDVKWKSAFKRYAIIMHCWKFSLGLFINDFFFSHVNFLLMLIVSCNFFAFECHNECTMREHNLVKASCFSIYLFLPMAQYIIIKFLCGTVILNSLLLQKLSAFLLSLLLTSIKIWKYTNNPDKKEMIVQI